MKTVFRPLTVLSAVMAVALAGAAFQTWTRHYFGSTPLSVELPKKLETIENTKVDDESDWVASFDEAFVEEEDYLVHITVFNGRSTTKADAAFLKSVLKDMVDGVSDNESSVKESNLSATEIDKKPTLKVTHTIGTGDEQYVMKSVLIGDGTKVYSVVGIGFPQEEGSIAAVDKVIGSVRFAKGLATAAK